METTCRKVSMKRPRSNSSSLDDEISSSDKSKAWDDPLLLEEMGLGILGSDVYTSDEGELKELLESSEADDYNENSISTKSKEITHVKKKMKTCDKPREPLKEQIDNKNVKNKNDGDTYSCYIENNITSPKKITNRTASGNDVNNQPTEDECKNDFQLSRIPLKEVDVSNGKDYFSQLPEELILTIFSKLDRSSIVRCCKVSHLFKRVANDESLWSRIDLTSRTLPRYSLGYMMRRKPFIVRLASAFIADPVVHIMSFPTNFSCSVQYLDLSMATISEQGLAKFLSHCTRLKKLSLENCHLNERATAAIAANRNLEVLNLAMCAGLNCVGLTKILTQCQRLQSLNLGWTNLPADAIDSLALVIPKNLERLNISGCRKSLSDQHVIDILNRCENLLELDISDCPKLTEVTINFIAKRVSGLEYLAISRCYAIPNECLRVLKKVSSLTYLDLFGMCTEVDLKTLRTQLGDKTINQFTFSSVARPTVGIRRSSIWGLKVRD